MYTSRLDLGTFDVVSGKLMITDPVISLICGAQTRPGRSATERGTPWLSAPIPARWANASTGWSHSTKPAPRAAISQSATRRLTWASTAGRRDSSTPRFTGTTASSRAVPYPSPVKRGKHHRSPRSLLPEYGRRIVRCGLARSQPPVCGF